MARLLQIGSVISVSVDDTTQPRAIVRMDGVESAPLSWLARAGDDRSWAPPQVGEQVLVACLSGDPANGVILGSLYCNAAPAPGDSLTLTRLRFADDAVIEYDTDSHALTATLPEGGTVALTAPGGVTVTGDVTINGSVSVTGDVAAEGDVTAGNISLTTHIHGGVQTGAGVTGTPQ